MIMRRMSLFASSLWWPRLAAWVLSALVAASAVAWGLRIGGGPSATDAAAPDVTRALVSDSTAVLRALGGGGIERATVGASTAPAPALESSRFVLLGVLKQDSMQATANAASHSTALVAVDGHPAKPVAVGAALVDGWILQSVEGRSAVLERQGSRITLELPALVPPVAMSAVRAAPSVAPSVTPPISAVLPAVAPVAAQSAQILPPQPAGFQLKGKTSP